MKAVRYAAYKLSRDGPARVNSTAEGITSNFKQALMALWAQLKKCPK